MQVLFPEIAQEYVSELYRAAVRHGVHLAERDMWVAYEISELASYSHQTDRKRKRDSQPDEEPERNKGRFEDGRNLATRKDDQA